VIKLKAVLLYEGLAYDEKTYAGDESVQETHGRESVVVGCLTTVKMLVIDLSEVILNAECPMMLNKHMKLLFQ
jgi:hypothetical protein